MGSADVVPGVSGGTMAFILGIYEELIQSIKSFDLKFVKLLLSFRIKDAYNYVSWRFLAAVGLGILMAIFSLASILSWLLEHRPVHVWSFFFGLILASVFMVGRHLKRWQLPVIIWMLAGTVGAYFLVGMVPLTTPDSSAFLFMCGAVSICAMILPGISGAFILVFLGKYHYILEAVNNREFLTLFIVAAGAGAGLITFVRFLGWLFQKHHDTIIAILTGLMLGSLRKVWPWKKTLQSLSDGHGGLIPIQQVNILPSAMSPEVIVAICLALAGLIAVLLIEKYQIVRKTNACSRGDAER